MINAPYSSLAGFLPSDLSLAFKCFKRIFNPTNSDSEKSKSTSSPSLALLLPYFLISKPGSSPALFPYLQALLYACWAGLPGDGKALWWSPQSLDLGSVSPPPRTCLRTSLIKYVYVKYYAKHACAQQGCASGLLQEGRAKGWT